MHGKCKFQIQKDKGPTFQIWKANSYFFGSNKRFLSVEAFEKRGVGTMHKAV